jgi:hypothetical protein
MFLLRRFSVRMGRAARPCHDSEHTHALQNTAPAFRSARTTVRSALASLLISQSPSPVPCPVPPGFNRPLVIPTLATYVDMTRRRAPLPAISPMGLPRLTAGFRGSRFQSTSPTLPAHHRALTNQSTSRRTSQRLVTTYPDASSGDAVNGLSYASISSACANEYQTIQISPRVPAPLPTPQKPTTQDTVRPSRAARCRDFHPFAHGRVTPVTWRPVSVSPDFHSQN